MACVPRSTRWVIPDFDRMGPDRECTRSSAYGETKVDFTTKWKIFLLEWRNEHTPLSFRLNFASLPALGAESWRFGPLPVCADGLCPSFNALGDSGFWSDGPGSRLHSEFRVVASRIERSGQKWTFCSVLTDLWRSRRSRGAKISKRMQKCIFLVFQRCGNWPFRAERPCQLEFLRFEGWT